MEIIINGRPAVKKNSRRLVKMGSGQRFLLPSEAFEKFKIEAIAQIWEQHPKRMNGAVRVHCDFYIKGKYHVDGDNLLTSILDILQNAKVIANDDNVMAGSFTKHPGTSFWQSKISIEPMGGVHAQ